MATSVKNGGVLTSADNTEVEIQIDESGDFKLPDVNTQAIIVLPSDNSGTVQFSVGEAVTADHYAWPAGSQVFLSFKNGVSNIRYKASAASQRIVVTV